MLNLEKYLAHSIDTQKAFLTKIIEDKGYKLFKDTLFLSFLGARICYSSTSPLALFKEERFRDLEKFLAFLDRLKKMGHSSIFAHSPLVTSTEDLSERERASLASVLYKAWWTPDGKTVCLNLRHFAEVLDKESFVKILSLSLEASKIWQNFRCLCINFDEDGKPQIIKEKPLGDLILNPPLHKAEMWAEMQVTIIDVARNQTEPFGWLAVLVEGGSRLFSHQFVRHTWLNFNQRSHRYTELDQFVLPPSFESVDSKVVYKEIIEEGLSRYQYLMNLGIKKEDARFVTPQGASTSLIATGPYFVWEDFVRKRIHKKAQWEIRRLAQAVNLALEKFGLKSRS